MKYLVKKKTLKEFAGSTIAELIKRGTNVKTKMYIIDECLDDQVTDKKRNEYVRQWGLKNPEAKKRHCAKYRVGNRDKINEYAKSYRLNNKEKIRDGNKRYYLKKKALKKEFKNEPI